VQSQDNVATVTKTGYSRVQPWQKPWRVHGSGGQPSVCCQACEQIRPRLHLSQDPTPSTKPNRTRGRVSPTVTKSVSKATQPLPNGMDLGKRSEESPGLRVVTTSLERWYRPAA